ncbi:hypothetical protein OG352_06180 [Streptomyces sp. NBC_01485]|uniref:hypothetical protein n=1 Tax=Streptomyces sp. NBC_01485 TaxID=2903884 RepID=UPI002E33F379|nr:hypothetical protein [Streptomyces sp. NBC_01485]
MTDHLSDRIAAAVGKTIDDDPMDNLTDLAEHLTARVLAALLATGADREERIPLDHLTSDQLDRLYDDLDRYAEVVGEMNDNAVRQAKELAEMRAKAATPRELELRQRHTWSAAGQCPMCGYDDCSGRLCSDCATTVRRMPASDRRQWRRYESITESAPIQGHGYTPAGLLGAALDSTEPTP